MDFAPQQALRDAVGDDQVGTSEDSRLDLVLFRRVRSHGSNVRTRSDMAGKQIRLVETLLIPTGRRVVANVNDPSLEARGLHVPTSRVRMAG